MHDRRSEGPDHRDERHDERREDDRGRGGPPDTSFLDLEMSKVLYGEAAALTREAAREILKEAIKTRLRERLGPTLEAIARVAADELADDVEANLDIEARIAARQKARVGRDEALKKVFYDTKESPEKG
jgi:hypothetical protein